jgi:Fe-S cluster assembly protein SufD
MIRLEPGAQKTDAYQQNRTLLLSTDARIHSIPGLEIQANDVRCSHGATAGQLDPEMVFYLRSRGLPETQARRAIVGGFLEDVLQRFSLDGVVGLLRERLEHRMGSPLPDAEGAAASGASAAARPHPAAAVSALGTLHSGLDRSK